MIYSQADYGRIFVIRLEDGDILHHEIEKLAIKEGVSAAALIAVGGADKKSSLVVGPENGRSEKINPMQYITENVTEITGTGTLFPDSDGNPVLHMHIACGRNEKTVTGCVRNGVKVWHIMEIIMLELINTTAKREIDKATGFKLLQP